MRSEGGRAAVFAALETGRRADAVVRRLADGIALGLLSPNEQLPSETELADTFGVSTSIALIAALHRRLIGWFGS